MERETGIGPATNSLEGCDSTTELLPLTSGTKALRRIRLTPLTRMPYIQYLELTERLELSTSPLPRECSTTELRQPYKSNLTILPRTKPSE